jgi:hypothetical protein
VADEAGVAVFRTPMITMNASTRDDCAGMDFAPTVTEFAAWLISLHRRLIRGRVAS